MIRKRREEIALDADGLRYLMKWVAKCRDVGLAPRIRTVSLWANGCPLH